MNLRITRVVALVAVLFLSGSFAVATPVPVSWSIDSSKSSFSLAIPDQTVNISGTTATIRVRNQNGTGNVWNTGNKAAIGGTVATTWDPNTASPTNPILAFTGSGLNIIGVNSGNYRPAISQYSGGTVNPDGTASGGNYSGSALQPAVFAALIKATDIITANAAYISFYNTNFNVTSGNVGVAGGPSPSGTGTGSFNGTQTNLGIQQSLLAFDGLSFPLIGQVIPDAVEQSGALVNPNANSGGGIVYNGLVGGLVSATLTLPVTEVISIDLGNNSFLTGTGTGTIVMNAFLPTPEPSTLMIAGLGLVSLAVCARRKLFTK